ncbi:MULTISPECIES: hypothetical protein [Flavobacteriaceae]|uniref:hypothetical protein n=1 Tax=Flavobacteriaceae TaxID=49546 RepID=UPI0025E011AC|nr:MULTISPECIES: hypothetical protein [Flavobacteriaceae]
MKHDHAQLKEMIIEAAYKSVIELIKVLADEIISDDTLDDISADKMRNAVLAKKTALDDAFYILSKIETEKNMLEGNQKEEVDEVKFQSFAEKRSKGR